MAGGDPIRDKLALGKPLFNAWLSLGAPFVVEMVADAGADLVTIDQQHGIGGNAELIGCLTGDGAARESCARDSPALDVERNAWITGVERDAE